VSVSISVANAADISDLSVSAANAITWSATDTVTQLGSNGNAAAVITGMRFWLVHINTGNTIIDDSTTSGITGLNTASASRTFTIAANTLTAGENYVVRLHASDPTETAYQDVVFKALTATVTPTITVPAAAAVIGTPSSTVTWTLTNGNTHYQVQVLNGSTITYDSGIVASTAQTTTASFPDTGVSRTVRVRARRNSSFAWSAWATVAVTVSHIAPPTPVVTAFAAQDTGSIGVTHAMGLTVTQPTPSGGQPAVATSEVWVRKNGDTLDGMMVSSSASAVTAYTWRAPAHGVIYQVRVKNIAADGRNAWSAWFTATSAPVLRGVVLYSLAAPTAPTVFRLNREEAADDYQAEAALIVYDGRAFPVVEFGTGGSRVLQVTIDLRLDADRDALRTMLLSRTLVLYRDRRGRKMYALVQAGPIQDTFYGYSTTLTITQVDNPADRLV
jgi:hypothetical protein